MTELQKTGAEFNHSAYQVVQKYEAKFSHNSKNLQTFFCLTLSDNNYRLLNLGIKNIFVIFS